MFGNAPSYEEDAGYVQRDDIQNLKFETPIITVCIPKVEPCFRSDSNEDLSNIDEFTESPIPFTAPYKLKDPIVLLERCDKIWETLQLIKDVQNRSKDQSMDDETTEIISTPQKTAAVPHYLTESEPSYIKYSPILGNIDRTIPSFKLSVKTKRKLYTCITCGKQYAENRSLRIHSNNVHGIYIPPRHRAGRPHNKDAQEGKQPTTLGRHSNDSDVLRPKQNEKEQNTDVKDPALPPLAHQKLETVSPPHKRRRINSQSQDNSVSTDNEVVRSTYRTRSTAEDVPLPPPNVIQQDPPKQKMSDNYVKCVLCSRRVRHVKQHFIHYHKIGCTIRILKELGQEILPEDQPLQQEFGKLKSEKLKSEKLESEKPESENPGSEKLESENAESEKLEFQTPESRKPESEKLEFQKPESQKPESEKVESEKSESETPESEKPESQKSESEKAELPNNKVAQEDSDTSLLRSSQLESDNSSNDKAIMIETCKTDVSSVERKKKVTFNDNKVSSTKDETASSKAPQSTPNKVYKCDICFGVYSGYNALWKHKRTHRLRGETKENFHLFTCRYTRSPLFVKDKSAVSGANSTTTSSSLPDNRNVNDDTRADLKLVNKTTLDALSNSNVDSISNGDKNEYTDTVCACGRVFRNPHTLYMHKSNCRLQKSEENENPTDNKADRDSGVGIHITIKKRNDSYEIVGRDGDENKPNTTGHPEDKDALPGVPDHVLEDCSNIQTNDKQLEAMESSKYSKHHSIVKLEIVDEDMDVEIEEVFANDKVEQDKVGIKTESDLEKVEEGESKENNQKLIPNQVPTLTFLCNKVLAVSKQQKKRNPIKRTIVKNNNICICGRSLPNQRLLKVHMAQAHPLYLSCGYCKENLKTVKMYNDHKCTIKQGKTFVEPNVDLTCPYCNLAVKSYASFDDHISQQHSDPAAPFNCYTCSERFSTISLRKYHFNLKHGNSFCSVCYKKMTFSVKLKHECYHLGLGYPCHTCKKAFPSKELQSRHMRMVHNNINDTLLTCPVCSKIFKKRSFKWHVYSHFNAGQSCRVCGELVRSARALDYHAMVLHRGIYPKLKCSSCDACFLSIRALEKHKADGMCHMVSERSEEKGVLSESKY